MFIKPKQMKKVVRGKQPDVIHASELKDQDILVVFDGSGMRGIISYIDGSYYIVGPMGIKSGAFQDLDSLLAACELDCFPVYVGYKYED